MEKTKILIVDDELDYRETHRCLLELKGYSVKEASNVKEALEILSQEYFPIVISDVVMPDKDGFYLLNAIKNSFSEHIEVIIVTGYGSIENAVVAMQEGAFGYFIKSSNPEKLFSEIEKALKLTKWAVQRDIDHRNSDSKLFLNQTKNFRVKQIINDIESLGDSDCNVLLTGESGVGKEIFAKLIHEKGLRRKEVFMPINCQAISTSLLEDELFGHEKHSFTGANTRRLGRFEEASSGTVFLDEIGEIHHDIQVKLLRVLEGRYIERIGSNKQIPIDIRLITATNKNLEDSMAKKEFREDLYYRINTVNIHIPPLRQRREDIKDMVEFFIDMYSKDMKKKVRGVNSYTKDFLYHYDYPGNIRELKNIIERLIVLSPDGILRLENYRGKVAKGYEQNLQSYKDAKKEFEINYLKNALLQNDSNISKTAMAIGLSRRQLFNKVSLYNLK